MKKTVWFAVALVMVVALVVALPALSQPGGNGGPGGPPGVPGMGGPMGMPPAPPLVVTDKGVYVMMGPQIYRLDPETLKVLAKGELPRPEPPSWLEAPAKQ